MSNCTDSEIDVSSLDEDVGFTVVAAETYVKCTDYQEEQSILPLSDKDLLQNKRRKRHAKDKRADGCLEKQKVVKNTKYSEERVIALKPEIKPAIVQNNVSEEDSMFDGGVDCKLNQFYFESDHLAIKNNSDYQSLLKTLALLEAQKCQAIKDLECLQNMKDNALSDPLNFVSRINDKPPVFSFPVKQNVARNPEINWLYYMSAYSGVKFLPHITTRNIIKNSLDLKEEEESSDESFTEKDNSYVPKKLSDEKSVTFNKKWTVEEQEKLEKLLVIYPPEEVEQRRWEKIAKALGNRTRQQVTSRIQKYFLKLAKANLPIPGRSPSTVLLQQVRRTKSTAINFKNSSFFPSWQPKVKMTEHDEMNVLGKNVCLSEVEVSDDDDLPDELKKSVEYTELMELKKVKRLQSLMEEPQSHEEITHSGFMCDKCHMDPIIGVRWHCKDCPPESTVDFCEKCSKDQIFQASHHDFHKLVAIDHNTFTKHEDDYTSFEQQNKIKYNYLDPNFVPQI